MTPREFVEAFAEEKRSMLECYLEGTQSAVGAKVAELRLTPDKQELLAEILDGVLTDAFYTILLGLDGEASIGGRQVAYELRDEDGNALTGGEIEAEAWQLFHANDDESNEAG